MVFEAAAGWIVRKSILSVILLYFFKIHTCYADKVFLVDGMTSNQGRLEVVIDGQRGLVYDKGWDLNDAKVVCRMLGLPTSTHAVKRDFFGYIYTNPPTKQLMRNVRCIGNESSLFHCPFDKVSDSVAVDNAGVICGKATVKFQLVSGRSRNEGIVHITFGKRHGRRNKESAILCDEEWSIKDARTMCKTLGYPDAMFAVFTKAVRTDYQGAYILLKDLHCQLMNESRTKQCSFSDLEMTRRCRSKQVGVICGERNSTASTPLQIVGGPSASSGRVEIYLAGHWGTICYDKWSINNAHVVCRSLGYSRAYVATAGSIFGPGNGRIVLNNVECSGNESSLLQCKHDGLGSKSCKSMEEAGVFCEKPEVKFKLVGNGHTPNQGMVVMNISGITGTICNKEWDHRDAIVLCRSLGLGNHGYAVQNLAFGKGTGMILLSNMNCSGNETDLLSCDHDGLGSHVGCTHYNDAGVICGKIDQVRLVGGDAWNQGRPEIQIDGKWGCIRYLRPQVAAAVLFCSLIGLPGEGHFYENSHKSSQKTSLVYDVGKCNLTGKHSILDCPLRYNEKNIQCGHLINCGPPSGQL